MSEQPAAAIAERIVSYFTGGAEPAAAVLRADLTALAAAARAGGDREATDRACRAVCEDCERGYPVARDDRGGWYHTLDGTRWLCGAVEIREAAACQTGA